MRAFVKGMLARSKAGHDTGKLFVVMQAEEEFVYLADGRCRTLDKQKKKEKKAHSDYLQNTRPSSGKNGKRRRTAG